VDPGRKREDISQEKTTSKKFLMEIAIAKRRRSRKLEKTKGGKEFGGGSVGGVGPVAKWDKKGGNWGHSKIRRMKHVLSWRGGI